MKSILFAIPLLFSFTLAHPLSQNTGSLGSNTGLYRRATVDSPNNGTRQNRFTVRAKLVDTQKTGVETGVKQYSGYFDDKENDKHIFFWFFESRSNPKQDPVVYDVSGGPGCSGVHDILTTFGAGKVKDGQITRNEISFHNYASMLYIDQPVNTGFSYAAQNVNNTVTAARDLTDALTAFFQHFPEYSTQDFHIHGISYAGRTVPILADDILSRKPPNVNLKSIMIGNGMIDPASQVTGDLPLVCGKGGYPSLGSPEKCLAAENSTAQCTSDYLNCYEPQAKCEGPPDSCVARNIFGETGRDTYDIRKQNSPPSDPNGPPEPIDAYFRNPAIIEAIGAEGPIAKALSFTQCNNHSFRDFGSMGDGFKPYHRVLPGILEQIPVLIYNGDADFLCTWLGGLATAEAVEWPGKAEFKQEQMKPFILGNGTEVGQTKSARGRLSYTRIYQAGHSAFSAQPEAAAALCSAWLKSRTVPSSRK
ncbi:hypothetical protein ABW20_dc0102320 [Dactylellina cionopaga]|nr:hypothetical protein ABW20_dc0102320 [Dactylellina cionopaga]